jgi:hypothetical protein
MSIETRVNSYTLYFPGSINYTHVSSFTSKGGVMNWQNGELQLMSGATADSLVSLTGYLPCYLNQEETVTVTINAAFSPPTSGNKQMIGVGDGEEGCFIGYNGTTFGMLITRGGSKRYWNLTFNSGATSNGQITITLLDQQFVFPIAAGMTAMQVMYSILQSQTIKDANIQLFASPNSLNMYTDGCLGVQPTAADSIDTGATGIQAVLNIQKVGQAPQRTWIYSHQFNEQGSDIPETADLTQYQVYRFDFSRWSNGRISLMMLDPASNNYKSLYTYVPPVGFNTSIPYTPHIFTRNRSDNSNEALNTSSVTLRTSMANITSGTPASNTNSTVYSTNITASQVTVDSANLYVIGALHVPMILNGQRNYMTSSVSEITALMSNASRHVQLHVIASGGITSPIALQNVVPWSTMQYGIPTVPTYTAQGLDLLTTNLLPSIQAKIEPKQLWLAPSTTAYLAITASAGAPMTIDVDVLVEWSES